METTPKLCQLRVPDNLQWRELSKVQWQGKPFPFKPIDDSAVRIATSLTSPFTTEASPTIPDDFTSLIAINSMFENGYHIPARSAALAKIASSQSITAAYQVGEKWGVDPSYIDSIVNGQAEIEKLVAKDSITVNNLASMPAQTLALSGYIVQELSDIAQGVKPADPARLDRLAHITDLYFVNSNDAWEDDGKSVNGIFNAMAGTLKDVAFWAKHPETYAFMSDITSAVSGIAPTERYNYERLTDLVSQVLLQHHIIKQDELNKGLFRVIGSVKSIASTTLKVDMAVKNIIDDIFLAAQAMNLPASHQMPQTPDETLTMLDSILQNAQTISPDTNIMNQLIERLYEQRAIGYDQQRCRIQVADKRTFDTLVRRMHSRLKQLKWGTKVGRFIKPGPSPYNLDDYMRTSTYDGVNPPTRKKYTIPKHPSDFIIDFLKTVSADQVGYAAYHHWSPFFVSNVSGRTTPVNFETQITLGGGPIEGNETRGTMEQMWKMAALAYYNSGDYAAAGITPEYIETVNRRAKKEAFTIQ